MRDIASVRAASPGPPLPTPGLSGFRVPPRRFGRAKPRGEDGEGGLESPEGQHPTGATRGCRDMNIRDDG